MMKENVILFAAVLAVAGNLCFPVTLAGAETAKGSVAGFASPGDVELPDTDKDGVPDEVEQRFGMDMNNPADALWDSDGDGFSNLFEIEHQFDPSDPLDHPPFWWRLQVQKVVRVDFPVTFADLKNAGSENKKEWLLGIEITGTPSSSEVVKKDVQIGDMLTIRGKRFRVTDVEKNGSSAEMVLQAILPEKREPLIVKLTLKEKLFDWCPVLLDTGDPKRREYVILPGKNIALGLFAAQGPDGKVLLDAKMRRMYIRTYMLLSVDMKSLSVIMTDGRKIDEKYVEFEITPNGKIPVDRWPVKR